MDAAVAGVAYTIRTNLLVRANKNGANRVDLSVGSNALNSLIRNNNLHLVASDTANRDTGTTGPPDDIDRAARSGAVDLGADEYGAATGSVTAAVVVEAAGGQPAPASGGTCLLRAGGVHRRLATSIPVTATPGPLTFMDSDGQAIQVVLAGTVPGSQFSGAMVVDTGVAEGMGSFSLLPLSLDGGQGDRGDRMTSGFTAVVDRTAANAPTGVQTQ